MKEIIILLMQFRQVMDKYLVQDRSTGDIFETLQFMYMMISATLFAQYPKDKRMSYVKKYYDAVSKFKINIPTPVMGQLFVLLYVSLLVAFLSILMILCLPFLVVIWTHYTVMLHKEQTLASTLEGFEESTKIRGGEIQHTGVIPFLKNLKQRLDVAHKTELEGDQQRHTSQSGI